MTKDEALKLALEFLEQGNFVYPTSLATAIKEALAQPEQKYRRGDRLVCLETDEYCVIHISGTNRQWVKFPDMHIGVYTNEQVDQLFEKLAKETDLAQPEIPMQNNNPGLEWDKIPKSFDDWWNSDYDPTGNPFQHETPAYWAWAGWKASSVATSDTSQERVDETAKQRHEQEPVVGQPLPCPFCGHIGLDFSDGNTYRWGIASCGGCGASCGEIRREYPDEGKWHSEAIAEWNRRTTPPHRKPLTSQERDAQRWRFLMENSYDSESVTQFHVWEHSWEPHSQTGEPTEWKQRVRGIALIDFIDRAIEQAHGIKG